MESRKTKKKTTRINVLKCNLRKMAAETLKLKMKIRESRRTTRKEICGIKNIQMKKKKLM